MKHLTSSLRGKRRSSRRLSICSLALAAPLSLVSLTGCEGLTPEDILEIVEDIKKNRIPGTSSQSFEMTDPNARPKDRDKDDREKDRDDDWEDEEGDEEKKDKDFDPDVERPEKDMDKGDRRPSDGGTEGTGVPGGIPGGAARAIAEADLIQRSENLLYALSEYRGLTIVDLANPDQLKILGEFKSDARPFEMYVKDGIVTAMLRNVMDYETDGSFDEPVGGPRSTSQLLVLDATDPANIKELVQFNIPGRILDSRQVGSTLYVMSYQNSYCWQCEDTPMVRVSSFNVQDPRNPAPLSSLDLKIPQNSWGPEPSLMATNEHLYVALNDRNSKEGALSAIRTIDISDPTAMVEKDAIPLEGAVTSRWQMNEYKDVLRVVSQPFGSLEAPTVQTFDVADLGQLEKLGQLTMTLPRPEQLQSVRFDQSRAYAITFERTDPLFILDLEDPKNPMQKGELEIPGWVYHMEPRGDRLLGIGFDRENPQGSLHASLFDVSDMNKPTMLSRVNFGGSWANFAEGQNQIHKSLKIWDEEQLLTIPFQGNSQVQEFVDTPDGDRIECEQYQYKSGVVLVDWKDDALTLRGEALTDGVAKRSFLYEQDLVAVSDQSVSRLNISNRDKPTTRSQVKTVIDVNKLVDLGDGTWLRKRGVRSNNILEFDIVTSEQLDGFTVLGSMRHEVAPTSRCEGYTGFGEVFAHEGYVYVEAISHPRFSRDERVQRSFLIFDIRDPKNPKFVNRTAVVSRASYGSDQFIGGVYFGGRDIVRDGAILYVSQSNKSSWRQRESESSIVVYKLQGPEIVELRTITRPKSRYWGEAKVLANGKAMSWYAVASNPEDSSKITFYWQDVRVEGSQVTVRDQAVPGVPLMLSDDGNSMLSMGFDREVFEVKEDIDCYRRGNVVNFDWQTKRCTTVSRRLNRVSLSSGTPVLLGSEPLAGKDAVARELLFGRNRLVYSSSERPEDFIRPALPKTTDPGMSDDEAVDGRKSIPFPTISQEFHALTIDDAANIVRSKFPEVNLRNGGRVRFLSPMKVIRGDSRGAEVYDLSDLSGIQKQSYRSQNRSGWCDHFQINGDDLVCPGGTRGVFFFEPDSGSGK